MRSDAGRWRLELQREPPSLACKQHQNSQLCRYAVQKTRERQRRQLKPTVRRKSAAFVTLVSPLRAVPFGRLRAIDAQDELQSIRRMLPPLPPGAVAVGWLDIAMRNLRAADGGRQRWWLPHLHLVAFGMDGRAARKWLGSPYRPTPLVPLPKHVGRAPTPLTTLAYALKHVDDVRAGVVLANPTGPPWCMDQKKRRRI
jgi:hypothetical protein